VVSFCIIVIDIISKSEISIALLIINELLIGNNLAKESKITSISMLYIYEILYLAFFLVFLNIIILPCNYSLMSNLLLL